MALRVDDVDGGSIVSGYLPSPDPTDRLDDRVLASSEGGAFTGRYSSWRLGRLSACDVTSEGEWTASLLAPSAATGRYIVGTLVEGEGTLRTPTTLVRMEPASLIFYRAWDAFEFEFPTDGASRYSLFAVTPRDLRMPESSLARLARQVHVDRSPFSAALAGMMTVTGSAVDSLTDGELQDAGEYALEMTRRTVALAERRHHERTGDPRLTAVLDWIEQHLPDPDLAPETIAAAHHISVRQVHRMFAGTGETCGHRILRRRLERIHEDIAVKRRDLPIAVIAQRWGMTDTAHLARPFRKHFGYTPRDARRLDAPSPSGMALSR